MRFTTFFIDLDETVYPSSCGLWDAIRERIDEYMHQEMGFDPQEIPDLRRAFYTTYGTTLRGLQAVYGIDSKHYLDFVHDIPLDKYLTPDPILSRVLQSYPQQKIIFTNADTHHAHRVLKQLELLECFDHFIDIFTIHPYCKPQPQAFETALRHMGVNNISECVFIDDNLSNLATARNMGFFTIRVGSQEMTPESHASIFSLQDLPRVLASSEE